MSIHTSMIDVMKSRHSVRAFDSKNLSKSHIHSILEFLHKEIDTDVPFEQKGKIEWIQVTNNVSDQGIKLGTYGFIKNPNGYFVGIAENNKYGLVEFAYKFHRLVLFLTKLGIGTCWMGGTFNRNSFMREIQLDEREFIPCITPVGYPKEKQRMFDKALRYVVKADNKKPWEQLFFDRSFHDLLKREDAGYLETPIEMVRLAPSASNKQPWRLLLSEDRNICHFYIEHTPNYSSKLGYDMQLLDIGISMCQFAVACEELKIQGDWKINDPQLELPNENYEYIISWQKMLTK